MTTVPVVDMSKLRGGSDAELRELVAQIDKICREIGFFQVVGHGVDEGLIQRMYDLSRAFFDQPTEVKKSVAQPNPQTIRGYCAVGEQSFAYSDGLETPTDLHEKFDVGPVDVPDGDPYYSIANAGPHFLPNQWPESPVGMEAVWTEYFHTMNALARDIMSLFSLALGLPSDHFASMIDKDISMLRAIHYPHTDIPPLPGQMRAGAHTDYGSVTIVRQEVAAGGLEVFTQDGDWVPVPVVPGAFVVNIGDLMAQWTNDEWVSTRHRVAPPPPNSGDTRRMSLVFFHQPNYDAVIECLPTVLGEGESPRYAPVLSGDHLLSKFEKTTAALGLGSTVGHG
ncbi:2-oxoglutarate and iron-dependent oxygenase domain-containing protein [Streptomyces sp. NPDC096057]|uniref:isopenicillin N synthase family dioxygenase n=1 Tax=Streptomyces sp. NPDC096057 TaxID=3155543 RepID=UPI0033189A43